MTESRKVFIVVNFIDLETEGYISFSNIYTKVNKICRLQEEETEDNSRTVQWI